MAIEDYLTLAEPTDEVIETDAVNCSTVLSVCSRSLSLAFSEIKAHVADSLKGGAAWNCIPPSLRTGIFILQTTETLLKQIHPFGTNFTSGRR